MHTLVSLEWALVQSVRDHALIAFDETKPKDLILVTLFICIVDLSVGIRACFVWASV